MGNRPTRGARHQRFDIGGTMDHSLQNFVSEIGNIISRNLVNDIIRKGFFGFIPCSARNPARGITLDHIGNWLYDKFH